jgi:hypothetical protein
MAALSWLDIWAALDYMKIHKPRMDGHTPPGDVVDTVGTITRCRAHRLGPKLVFFIFMFLYETN